VEPHSRIYYHVRLHTRLSLIHTPRTFVRHINCKTAKVFLGFKPNCQILCLISNKTAAISTEYCGSFILWSTASGPHHSSYTLPVQGRIIFMTAAFVWKCIHSVVPPYLQQFCVLHRLDRSICQKHGRQWASAASPSTGPPCGTACHQRYVTLACH